AGVLGFMPPESTWGAADRRSDGWSLGMVTIHALLGHPRGDLAPHELERELSRTTPNSRNASELSALLASLTSVDRTERPTDLLGWARAVAAHIEGPPLARRRLVKVLGDDDQSGAAA